MDKDRALRRAAEETSQRTRSLDLTKRHRHNVTYNPIEQFRHPFPSYQEASKRMNLFAENGSAYYITQSELSFNPKNKGQSISSVTVVGVLPISKRGSAEFIRTGNVILFHPASSSLVLVGSVSMIAGHPKRKTALFQFRNVEALGPIKDPTPYVAWMKKEKKKKPGL